jgi:NADPH2:quinone reductase
MPLPISTRALALPAYNTNLMRAMLSLKVQEMPLPALGETDVLIQIEAAPINPSDIAFLQGGYNVVKPLPAIPGFEATGVVVGTGEKAQEWMGKRVSCFSQDEESGAWAAYMVTRMNNCLEVPEQFSLELAATMGINPLTALGMFEMALQKKSTCLVMNAAGGAVPALLRILAENAGMKTVQILRKHVEEAKAKNNYSKHHFLCSEDENFEQQLSDLLQEESSVTLYDAVGGTQSGVLFNAAPMGSQLIVYGGLSNEAIAQVDVLEMIFKQKEIKGFNLNDYLAEHQGPEQRQKLQAEVHQLVGSPAYQHAVQGTFPLDQAAKAIRMYIKDMSAGKVLFKVV